MNKRSFQSPGCTLWIREESHSQRVMVDPRRKPILAPVLRNRSNSVKPHPSIAPIANSMLTPTWFMTRAVWGSISRTRAFISQWNLANIYANDIFAIVCFTTPSSKASKVINVLDLASDLPTPILHRGLRPSTSHQFNKIKYKLEWILLQSLFRLRF